MFRDPVLRRSVDGEGETMQQGDHQAHSPTQTQGHQPRIHSATNYPPHQQSRPPPSPSHTTELPPISTALHSRDTSASKYYDPTSDHGERGLARDTARYDPQHSPQQTRETHTYSDARPAHSPYEKPYQSPIASSYAHQSPLQRPLSQHHHTGGMEAMSHSPVSPSVYHANRGAVQPPPANYARRPSMKDEAPPPTRADPMSLSSIMSAGTDSDPPAKAQPPASLNHDHGHLSKPPNAHFVKQEPMASPAPADLAPHDNGILHRAPYDPIHPVAPSHALQSFATPRDLPAPDEAEIEAALAHIETKQMNDLDGPGAPFEHEEWRERSLKRGLDVISGETVKRKKRRHATLTRYHDVLAAHRDYAKHSYNLEHEGDAWQQVQSQEIAEEKERKKDMQRKRRREKTIQNEEAKRAEALAKAGQADNEEEKERHLAAAQKAERKAKNTSQLLQGNAPSKDIREVTPHGPNLEGGTMSSFQASDDLGTGGKRKGNRGTGRLKKSKEQKQAEKDAAAAGQAAIDRGDDLPSIAPREEARLGSLRDRSYTEELGNGFVTSHDSSAYRNLYAQIIKDLARKDVPKVVRIKENSLSTKQSNLRKTAQLAAKEARRWQMRTNKNQKDTQARAKRGMREMLAFWKRNERDERESRKNAERQELENAKKVEAEREANRQKRKLNFLISQTELYSHFIGKKARTAEIERSTDDAETAASAPAEAEKPGIDVDGMDGNPTAKVTNFEDLDFDNDDESALNAAAMANAQHAIQEAQDRARAFNNPEGQEDDGELNFQNPSGLQNKEDWIPQPKLLNCTLKEYQLKGLNWLVNLYEQGINGILADEMGLGKTVQSISVMAYLAERYNIWGPFLVIAPASTLHNWQQEIAKFVPDLNVIPYWGTAKDRKVLRKLWDRKHVTYTRDSPFHVVVSSYQLVVQDAQYFQKMRWQYMILDEAQAIKSSNSSRWKSLLNFHSRNRLLLTGTPIQNNMQELWALLHFIMPSLFDSHDEFSEWFSKDIESHAQSNTKLNEDQLRRLHMILKPFMLRRVKKHVQKELGDKIELDVYCDLTYRQRAYYANLRNKISIMDLIEKAVGDEQDSATLMNLVMQFRKVCNHPDLFERADTWSPFTFASFAETPSFLREGQNVRVAYTTRNFIEYSLPRLIGRNGGRLEIAGPDNEKAGFRGHYLDNLFNIWSPHNMEQSAREADAHSWLRFSDLSATEVSKIAKSDLFERALETGSSPNKLGQYETLYDDENDKYEPKHSMLRIIDRKDRAPLTDLTSEGYMRNLMNVSQSAFERTGLDVIEPCAKPAAAAPPVELYCASQDVIAEKQRVFFNPAIRNALYGVSDKTEQVLLDTKSHSTALVRNTLPSPTNARTRYTHIEAPSMSRFVTDSGKLARLDALLKGLKAGDHRVLLYFQMTRMIDLMEEYLTYRNYKYCRLDGSTKLEDRRDTVADFQSDPTIFVFLLSTRAGGLGINLTSADTVIFYDSDWNPTIDSQAMDRAHRLGQTRQVTVYRLITSGTIEERIRKRALQKEEVQRVVISGGAGGAVDFNTRSRENRTKDMAMWLVDDEQAAEIEKKEAELAEAEKNAPPGKKRSKKKRVEANLDDMYHEGEGHFDESAKGSGAATPVPGTEGAPGAPGGKKGKKGLSKKAKTAKQRLAVADGEV
ncbi:chromatin-remodeling ATPase INO80 [Parastagonospora nodorum]|uniref:Chromatin-remodeling ATPase INO80 n=1 Tax=Phaeosphaeria nodorum (strain SN15 / ATCC MYA-4574 / FGSC 10173) TaxID=321614 RepID=A0A7U2F8G0_PHANO|nr:chromatin-remodeling ATPase INO80 [Parastagonospora nodorum]QRD00690.1 chromatin-remodeling ATPase INO80 [Parastagonospora nodorum SN15]KAH3925738.1 chromatin-remodeling ATPase INO80 [Parastagonospora nodorum]KAH3952845.1 chromatin-remodeling ATPase INO80 [Parastagonospora nodorum]KAH4132514.1 chromatin-remodeling ATPase INO80 [Parastagonospora nodorum]